MSAVPVITNGSTPTITGPEGRQVVLTVIANDPAAYAGISPGAFAEANGYVSVEAEHFRRAVETAVKLHRIPGLGRTRSGMEGSPVTAPPQIPGPAGPRLEYHLYLTDTGEVTVQVFFSPPLDQGLRYRISFDDDSIEMIRIPKISSGKNWEISVANNIFITSSRHHLSKPGNHVLKYWMVTTGLVLQKLVVDAGGVKPSYLGPPESDRTVF